MAKQKKLTDDDILAIIANELSMANVTVQTPQDLIDPLNYYLGNPQGNEQEGRSALISTDVADAIEWIIPQVMKSFTQNNEVVIFDPIGPDDEKQAELESEFVYDILMKQNDGFILIHQFVKDALMQRNGILKVYYENNEEVTTESYSGLSEEQLQMLVADPTVEILKLSENISYTSVPENPNVQYSTYIAQEIKSYDVKIKITNNNPKICIDAVPLEQFRVNNQHNSINLDKARFTSHIVTKSVSDLIEEGYDQEIVQNLGEANLLRSSYRFGAQHENTLLPAAFVDDLSSKLVDVCECFLKLDMDGDGIATPMKITVGDSLPPTVVLSKEEVDCSPWVACTSIIMSHKFKGLSIYDRLKQIQDNKTALLRNIMDNLYLQNNQRNVIVEGQVNIDDMLVSRPGGIIRTKRIDAITPLQTPQIGDTGFTMMKYLDEVKAGRVGVSSEGTATPQNIGDRVGSEGVERMMTAKEELVGLIIRVICETGIKPLCTKIRDLSVKHLDTVQDFKFRGEWVQVNPSSWKPRLKSTVRVGTGTGDHQKQMAAMAQVMAVQKELAQTPLAYICSPEKVYSALDDLCKFSGLNGAARYFVDPSSPEGQQAAQQAQQTAQQASQKQEQATVETLRQQAELAKSATTTAESLMANVQLKGQVELGKHQREMDKATSQAQIAALQMQLEKQTLLLDAIKTKHKDELDKEKMLLDNAIKLTQIEATAKADQDANFIANQQLIQAAEEASDKEEGESD
jgi:hypothetical protein